MVSTDNPGVPMSETSRARTHHIPPLNRNGMMLVNVASDHDVTGANRTRPILPGTVDASRTSDGVHDRKSGGGGIRMPAPRCRAMRRAGRFPWRPDRYVAGVNRQSFVCGAIRSECPRQERHPDETGDVGGLRRRVGLATRRCRKLARRMCARNAAAQYPSRV